MLTIKWYRVLTGSECLIFVADFEFFELGQKQSTASMNEKYGKKKN